MENSQQFGFWIGVLFGGFVAGAICGILPLVFALKKRRRGLAIASWISCVIAGLILGVILALPVAIIFTIIIVCLKKPGASIESTESDNSSGTIQ